MIHQNVLSMKLTSISESIIKKISIVAQILIIRMEWLKEPSGLFQTWQEQWFCMPQLIGRMGLTLQCGLWQLNMQLTYVISFLGLMESHPIIFFLATEYRVINYKTSLFEDIQSTFYIHHCRLDRISLAGSLVLKGAYFVD